MSIRNVWIIMLISILFVSAVQAEVILRTSDEADSDGGYTTVASDNNLNSQNANTVYQFDGLGLRHANASRIIIPVVRFDINSVKDQDMTGAILNYNLNWVSKAFTRTFDVWGIIDGENDKWDSAVLSWTTATTTMEDGGMGWFISGSGTYTNYDVNAANLQFLGTWTIDAPSAGNVPISSDPTALNLDTFLASDTNGLVTLVLTHPQNDGFWCGINSAMTPETAPAMIFPNALPAGASYPEPETDSTIIDLDMSQLCWKSWETEQAVLWFGIADANETNYQQLLTPIAVIDGPAVDVCVDIPSEMLPLSAPETYSWAVESYAYPASDPNHISEPNELITAAVWRFFTSAIPTVSGDPVDQYKFEGESASFTAVFNSVTPVTSATWYKVGTPDVAVDPADPDVTVTITNGINNQYSITLTIDNLEPADDGSYYCVADNDGGSSGPTASADLVIKRMLAHWDFNGNADDETGVYHGTLMGEPNFIDDGTRHAMIFDGMDDYVDLPDGFENFKPGLTFTVWANPTVATNWARFIDLGNIEIVDDAPVVVDNMFFSRRDVGTRVIFGSEASNFYTGGEISQNNWQMFVVTLDEAGNGIIYKNGMAVATGTVTVPAVVTRTSNLIGDSNWVNDAFYNGLIDDIKVYNYPLSEDEIAQMYVDIEGDFCRYKPAYDYNNNCIVDMGDLAIVASQWLQCGLHPDTACP